VGDRKQADRRWSEERGRTKDSAQGRYWNRTKQSTQAHLLIAQEALYGGKEKRVDAQSKSASVCKTLRMERKVAAEYDHTKALSALGSYLGLFSLVRSSPCVL